MPDFEPEADKKYEASLLLIAALREIDRKLSRIKQNETGRKYNSPFNNTGERFKCAAFEVEAYSWNDEIEQKFNFKWKDIEVLWYKYLGRGTLVNMEMTPDKVNELLENCFVALDTFEIEVLKSKGVL